MIPDGTFPVVQCSTQPPPPKKKKSGLSGIKSVLSEGKIKLVIGNIPSAITYIKKIKSIGQHNCKYDKWPTCYM